MNTADLLKITMVQSNLFWEDKRTNLQQFSRRIFDISEPTDIIVLPEMFSTGFTMNSAKLAETMDGFTVNWMKEMALVKGAAICGSLIIFENNKYYNRFLFVEPNGNIQFYDKAHLFRMAEENKYYFSGSSRLSIDYKGWRIAPFICYDLRFPIWLKRTEKFDYDLLLIVASWPQKRIAHWQALTQARAIENQCYLVAVNRVGEDANQISYNGQSALYNPQGKLLNELTNEEFETTFTIQLPELKTYRKAFPVWLDDDNFEIIN